MNAGIKNFRRGLARKQGAELLREYLAASPDFPELWAIWDAQITLQQQPIIVELLGLMTDLLRTKPPPAGQEPAGHAVEHGDDDAQQRLDELAHRLLKQKMKAVYFHLTSDSRARINAALFLLAAVCSRGPASTRTVLATFDAHLSSLPKIARPPRRAPQLACWCGLRLPLRPCRRPGAAPARWAGAAPPGPTTTAAAAAAAAGRTARQARTAAAATRSRTGPSGATGSPPAGPRAARSLRCCWP
jgi:hypothetical protein